MRTSDKVPMIATMKLVSAFDQSWPEGAEDNSGAAPRNRLAI